MNFIPPWRRILVPLVRRAPLQEKVRSCFRYIKICKVSGIDLYHTAAILSPRRAKIFVFARPALHWMRGEKGKFFCFSIAQLSSITCGMLLYKLSSLVGLFGGISGVRVYRP